MTQNVFENMSTPNDERLSTLAEIAHDCFGIETFPCGSDQGGARYLVCAESIARALDSAYDIGLIAGYRMSRATPA